MDTYHFLLLLTGVAEITAELSDKLYEATGGDIEFNMCDSAAFLELERTAPSLQEAVTSAIGQVEGSGTGVRVVRVETEAANTMAKINADLLGMVSGR